MVDDESAGQRLDNFLMRVLKGVPKTHVYRIIRSRRGAREQGPRRGRHARAKLATRCACRRCASPSANAGRRRRRASSRAASRTTHLLAIDKPAGVAVHGGSGVSFGVIEQLRRARPGAKFLELVHRLDRETSGVLLLAKKRSALTALQDQFRAARDRQDLRGAGARRMAGNAKVIDVPLHKYLGADGERRVRVGRRRPSGRPCARSRWCAWLQRFDALHAARRDASRPAARTRSACTWPRQGMPIAGDDKYGDFACNKALARGDALAGAQAHVPACAAACRSTTRPAASASTLAAPLPDCDTAQPPAGHARMTAPLRPDRLRLGRHAVRLHRADRALHPGRLSRRRRGRAQRRATRPT